ncbi:MAG TPA: acyltransferase [Chthonomonadaceae bacterium]|nr:acyltransferase [Chthonomonadaceae bacterium]
MAVVSAKVRTYKMLDAWRGFASLWVVMIHASSAFLPRDPQGAIRPLCAFAMLGYLGVQVFFVVSGYCIANSASVALERESKSAPVRFMRARLRRIFPPCWWSLVFFAAVSILARRMVTSGWVGSSVLAQQDVLHQKPLYFIANLTLTQCLLKQPFLSSPCWTLCYEVAFYGIVGLALLLLRGRNHQTLLTALHMVTIAALCLLILAPAYRFYPLDFWPQFGLGIVVYDCVTQPRSRRARLLALVIGLQTLLLGFQRSFPISAMGFPSAQTYLFCLGFAVTLLLAYPHDQRISQWPGVKWLGAIGVFSYSLYLIHYLLVGCVSQIVKLAGVPQSLYLVCWLLAILAAVGTARLFYEYFERPYMNSQRKPQRRKVPLAEALPEKA